MEVKILCFFFFLPTLVSESSVSVTWLSKLMLYTSVWTVSMMNRLMARLAVIDPGHDGHHAELIGFLSSINSISIFSHAQNIPLFHFSSSCQHHVLDQWERPDGIKHMDHPFSLSLSLLLFLSVFSPSLHLCPELNCVGVSVQLFVQASWVPPWSPLAMWSPLPSYYSASSSHQFIFNAPSLLSLTVSPHNSHSVAPPPTERSIDLVL